MKDLASVWPPIWYFGPKPELDVTQRQQKSLKPCSGLLWGSGPTGFQHCYSAVPSPAVTSRCQQNPVVVQLECAWCLGGENSPSRSSRTSGRPFLASAHPPCFLMWLFLLCFHKLVQKCRMRRFPSPSRRIAGPGLRALGSGLELLCSSVPGSCGSVCAPRRVHPHLAIWGSWLLGLCILGLEGDLGELESGTDWCP